MGDFKLNPEKLKYNFQLKIMLNKFLFKFDKKKQVKTTMT